MPKKFTRMTLQGADVRLSAASNQPPLEPATEPAAATGVALEPAVAHAPLEPAVAEPEPVIPEPVPIAVEPTAPAPPPPPAPLAATSAPATPRRVSRLSPSSPVTRRVTGAPRRGRISASAVDRGKNINVSDELARRYRKFVRRFEDEVELGKSPLPNSAVFAPAVQRLLERIQTNGVTEDLLDRLRSDRPGSRGGTRIGYSISDQLERAVNKVLAPVNENRGREPFIPFYRFVALAVEEFLPTVEHSRDVEMLMRLRRGEL